MVLFNCTFSKKDITYDAFSSDETPCDWHNRVKWFIVTTKYLLFCAFLEYSRKVSTDSLEHISIKFEVIWKNCTSFAHFCLRLSKAIIPFSKTSRVCSKLICKMLIIKVHSHRTNVKAKVKTLIFFTFASTFAFCQQALTSTLFEK